MQPCGGTSKILHMREPAEVVEDLEREAELPPGSGERFSGYGVMGLPFPLWPRPRPSPLPCILDRPRLPVCLHRDPHGRWTFYQDQPAELACTRYFGSAVDEVREGPIRIDWAGPRALQVPGAQRAAIRSQSSDDVGGDRQQSDRARHRSG